jgi:membrane protease subunit (stomatin/prohibitin family)
MLRRRRPLLRAAAVGGIAYGAGKAGANNAMEGADQDASAQQPEAEQEAAPAANPAPAASLADESIVELTKLKGLLDTGVLTQDEFDTQKQKILQSM